MHDDLLDAVGWAVSEKIAQKDKVAINGGSYGGYATLVGLTFTPDVVRVRRRHRRPVEPRDAAPDDPAVLGGRDRAASRSASATTARRRGRSSSLSVSPLTHVDRITKPLLIGQGANDPRVKQAESDQIVKAMQAQEHPGHVRPVPRRGPRLRAARRTARRSTRSRRSSSRSASAARTSRSATTSRARRSRCPRAKRTSRR